MESVAVHTNSVLSFEPIINRLAELSHRIDRSRRAHYVASDRLAKTSQNLNLFDLLASAVTAASLFAAIENFAGAQKFFIAISLGFSILSTITSGISSYLRLEERSMRHKDGGDVYMQLKTSCDNLTLDIFYSKVDQDMAIRRIKLINNKASQLAEVCPKFTKKDDEEGKRECPSREMIAESYKTGKLILRKNVAK